MIDHNKVSYEVKKHIKNISISYNEILKFYSKRAKIELGLMDCHIYSLAIIEDCKKQNKNIEDYLRENSSKYNKNTIFYIAFSLLEQAIALKLNSVNSLAAFLDGIYESIRSETMVGVHNFIKHYSDGMLFLEPINNDVVTKNVRELWVRVAMLALDSFYKARNVSLKLDLFLPLYQSMLEIQIRTLQYNLIEQENKSGLSISSVNLLAYNLDIKKADYMTGLASSIEYLEEKYKAKIDNNVIVSPHQLDINASIGL
jgi:hypothetical protein